MQAGVALAAMIRDILISAAILICVYVVDLPKKAAATLNKVSVAAMEVADAAQENKKLCCDIGRVVNKFYPKEDK